MKRTLFISLLLVAATVAVYAQVKDFAFFFYDDGEYVFANSKISKGLTADGAEWVLTEPHCANWHPLTGLSHMLDCELFGGDLSDAGPHHVVNVIFHVLNTLLLFGVLNAMSRAPWKSAFVAALFALHPLHVESVAWVSERKDVLSTFFWLLASGAYVAYVRRGGVLRYFLVPLCMALGLMAKPMVVTLPMVLLLLDYWPLRRTTFGPKASAPGGDGERHNEQTSGLEPRTAGFLVAEKIPLFALSAAGSWITYSFQKGVGAVLAEGRIDFPLRAANAAVSYVLYIWKMIWPADLTVRYPHPYLEGGRPWEWWQIAGAVLVLLLLSALVLVFRRRRYLSVGWLWFLGVMVPVIGLVQVGGEARADRYTYIPLIGLFIVIAWGVPGLVSRKVLRNLLVPVAILLLGLLTWVTWCQVGLWRDTKTLSKHSIELHPDNYLMHVNYATALAEEEDFEGAIVHLERALEISPGFTNAFNNLGEIYSRQAHYEKAAALYEKSVFTDPGNKIARYNQGTSLARKGDLDGAIGEYRKAIDVDPDYAEAHHNLGITLIRADQVEKGIDHIRKAIELKPDYVDAHFSLGLAMMRQRKVPDAVKHFQEAVRLDPGHIKASVNLAMISERSGKIGEAISHLEAILKVEPDNPLAKQNLTRLRAMKKAFR